VRVDRIDRPSARVVVIDDEGRVLLFCVRDPQQDSAPVWVTPGGGIEPGEDLVTAAARELFEETGVVASVEELGAPVAVARGEWGFRDMQFHSVDSFFLLRRPRFEPDPAGWTELEREIHSHWHWWTCEELDEPRDPVFPGGLSAFVRDVLAGKSLDAPVELPWSGG
jgi:8-oxo-dGTP pyrophosphatase MutT (NUDIX family)